MRGEQRSLPSAPRLVRAVEAWVKGQVSDYRFHHIRGVVAASRRLAQRHHLPQEKAVLAAWFHDCAKEWPKSKMRDVLKGSPFKLDRLEKKMPALWHPHAGAAAAYKEWGVRDEDVLEAIRCHTLGHARMGPLAQALFIADFVEPGRKFKGVEAARRAADHSLREGVLAKVFLTLDRLLAKKISIHPRLLETWNAFLAQAAPPEGGAKAPGKKSLGAGPS